MNRHTPTPNAARATAAVAALLLLPIALALPTVTHSLSLEPTATVKAEPGVVVATSQQVRLADGTIITLRYTGDHFVQSGHPRGTAQRTPLSTGQTPPQPRFDHPGDMAAYDIDSSGPSMIAVEAFLPHQMKEVQTTRAMYAEPLSGISPLSSQFANDNMNEGVAYGTTVSCIGEQVYPRMFKPGVQQFTLRYGIALGNWTDVAVYNPKNKATRLLVPGQNVRFIEQPGRGLHSNVLSTTDSFGNVARRYVVVTSNRHPVAAELSGYRNSIRAHKLNQEVNPGKVREVRLQTRPYQWIEFRHILVPTR